MRFEQVQIFILAKKMFWGWGHLKHISSFPGENEIKLQFSLFVRPCLQAGRVTLLLGLP